MKSAPKDGYWGNLRPDQHTAFKRFVPPTRWSDDTGVFMTRQLAPQGHLLQASIFYGAQERHHIPASATCAMHIGYA
jgi:hypothetical protein